MKIILFEAAPVNTATNTTTTIRLCSVDAPSLVVVDGNHFTQAVTTAPTRSINAGGKAVEISYSPIGISIKNNEALANLFWDGAQARIWIGDHTGTSIGSFTKIYEGILGSFAAEGPFAEINLNGNEDRLSKPLLTASYLGTGSAEGPSSLTGTLKPWCSGAVQNIEPVLVNGTYWIYQYHGYGATQAVNAVYEDALKVNNAGAGAPAFTVTTYAALQALTLTEGQWAAAPEVGMFRLGAAPTGKITADVSGAKNGGTYVSTVSTIVQHLMSVAALSGTFIDTTSIGAFTQGYGFYQNDQADIGETIREIFYQVGGYIFANESGVFRAGSYLSTKTPTTLSTATDIRSEPYVLSVKQLPSPPPIYRVKIGYDRCWATHSPGEISEALAEIQDDITAIDAAADAAAAAAALAQADANTANTRLASIANDSVLDRTDKFALITEYQAITSEQTGIDARATAYGITTEKTAYDNAVTALTSYLTGLSPAYNNTSTDTTIVAATFRAKFTDLYAARQTLLNKIAEIAGQRATWAEVSSRPTELTDGRIPAAIRAGGSLQGDVWGGAATFPLAELLESALTGKSLAIDPDFSRGGWASNVSTYDNASSGKLSFSMVTDASAPNGSGKVFRISYDGTGTPHVSPNPEFGGFVQALVSAGTGLSRPGYYSPNSKVAFIVRAKIPVGRTLVHASNLTGAEGAWQWLTSDAGTGAWSTYVGIRTIGVTGTFAQTGYFYIAGGSNVAFSWDVAKFDQIELSSAALPQLARLVDGSGNLRTDAELITSFGTAAAITGQGYLATQNSADWSTRIAGAGKPADNASSDLTLKVSGTGLLLQGNRAYRYTGGGAWDSQCYSLEGHTGGAYCSFVPGTGSSYGYYMAGLNTDPTTDANYTSLDYAFYAPQDNTLSIYESGTPIGSFGTYTYGDVLSLVYDGVYVRYFKNGTLLRTVTAAANLKFYFDSSIVQGDLTQIKFGPYQNAAYSPVSVNPLTLFGSHSQIVGNSVRKVSGTHGSVEGGCSGTKQTGTAFVSARPVQGNTWATVIGFMHGSYAPSANHVAAGNWHLVYTASSSGTGAMYIAKGGSTISGASWTMPNFTTDTRIALIFNGRRIFAMVDGVVYGGDTSAYDVTPGTDFWPCVWDYYTTGAPGYNPPTTDGVSDIRYGAWTDVRTYLDDGYTIIDQSGFKTNEGTAAAISGQGPGATATGADVLNYFDNGAVAGVSGAIASYSGGVSTTGVIKISLPHGYTNTMMSFHVDVYSYETNQPMTYKIGGYNYASVSGTNGYWINAQASFTGPESVARKVRFGHDGTKACIWIGEVGTVWQYPQIVVRDLLTGYSNNASSTWRSGWAVTINTTAPANAPSGSITEITKPRAGDAVFGEGIFEAGSGSLATLANFKTLHGTAAAITGQGALAIKNIIDLRSDVTTFGSLPPSVPDNGFTYVASSAPSLTISWPSMTIYRADGSTMSVASGSQAITGSYGTGISYKVYPYLTDDGSGSGTVAFVTGGSGTPTWLFSSSGNASAASQTILQGRIPLGNMLCAIPASGGGGGGGGGFNCLHPMTTVDGREACDLRAGDLVKTPTGEAKIAAINYAPNSEWMVIYSRDLEIARVTMTHPFYLAKSGEYVAARDVRIGDFLKTSGDHIEVTGLKLVREDGHCVGLQLDDEDHLHFVGPLNLVSHNGTAKP